MNYAKINQAILTAWERNDPGARIGTVKWAGDRSCLAFLPCGGSAMYIVPMAFTPFDMKTLERRLKFSDGIQRAFDLNTTGAEIEPATRSGLSRDNGKLVEIISTTWSEWFDKKLLSVFNLKQETLELTAMRGSKHAMLIVRDKFGVVGLVCPVAKSNAEGRA